MMRNVLCACVQLQQVCVCVCACVYACERACMCACVHACVCRENSCIAHHGLYLVVHIHWDYVKLSTHSGLAMYKVTRINM